MALTRLGTWKPANVDIIAKSAEALAVAMGVVTQAAILKSIPTQAAVEVEMGAAAMAEVLRIVIMEMIRSDISLIPLMLHQFQ